MPTSGYYASNVPSYSAVPPAWPPPLMHSYVSSASQFSEAPHATNGYVQAYSSMPQPIRQTALRLLDTAASIPSTAAVLKSPPPPPSWVQSKPVTPIPRSPVKKKKGKNKTSLPNEAQNTARDGEKDYPKLTRTIVNERKANGGSTQQGEAAKQSALTKATNSEDDGLSDYPDRPPNWRMMLLFNGKCKVEDFPANLIHNGCPQKDEGRTFPTRTDPASHSPEGGEEATPRAEKTVEVTTASNGHGYILANGRTWVREKPPDATVVDKPSVSSHKRAALSVSTSIPSVPQKTSPKGPKRARHPNMSLHIIGDKRIYADSSKECLQFAKLGTCPAGIFCSFEHNGSAEHQQKTVCTRMLRGLCRNNNASCPEGEHALLPHQFPLCDYYLRCTCIEDKCPYVHVKHTDGIQPCPNFNTGVCQQGEMCDRPHRYYYHVQKQKGATASSTNGTSASEPVPEEDPTTAPLLNWYA
ncbi:zinc finger protein [Aphelenchoides avenae]|nr:zinc finger protein [Aphelenchus avenae]